MPGYTTENMHFGLMRAGFAEAAGTQGRSVVSATDPGRVMTVVDDTTRLTGFPTGSRLFVFIQLFFFFSFFFTSIVTASYRICPSCGKTGELVDM